MKRNQAEELPWIVLLMMLFLAISCTVMVIYWKWTVWRFILWLAFIMLCFLAVLSLFVYMFRGRAVLVEFWRIVFQTMIEDLQKMLGR